MGIYKLYLNSIWKYWPHVKYIINSEIILNKRIVENKLINKFYMYREISDKNLKKYNYF